jgi:D-beta-D-heptose 7-phosphate kinase/D-beta-D-heptose 1-phosphate adenosyltransferase
MKVIVIGDVLLDINYTVETTRKAPEADIPIYKVISKKHIIGGAGNVAVNMRNLGCDVKMIGCVGNGHDSYHKIVVELFENFGINHKLFVLSERPTTQKHRYFCNNKLVYRADIEDNTKIDTHVENIVLDYVNSIHFAGIDAIILSDYNKGFLTPFICKRVIQMANEKGIPTFVDPKIEDFNKYAGCFLFKPNMDEAKLMSGEISIDNMLNHLLNKLNATHVLVTASEKGMYLYNTNAEKKHISQKTVDVVDVTGAGDIVMVCVCYMYIKTKNIETACVFANYIAGLSVKQIGNYMVSVKDIELFELLQQKIIYSHQTNKLELLRKYYSKIVFTNGCFDILHAGHIYLLHHLREEGGDCVVVGVNSDSSVERLKGIHRPINNIVQRTEALKAMQCIDFVVVFEQDTPYELMKALKPHTIVKGGDYKKEDIVGSDMVKKVSIYDYKEGYSTTSIIERSNALYGSSCV